MTEREQWEIEQTRANTGKLNAEMRKLLEEGQRIAQDRKLEPWRLVVLSVASTLGAVAAITAATVTIMRMTGALPN